MVSVLAKLLGCRRKQRLLDRERCLARGKPRAIGDPKYMRIDANGRLAEDHVEDDVGGLAPDARQGFERGALARYLAIVQFDELTGERCQVLGLHIVQAN